MVEALGEVGDVRLMCKTMTIRALVVAQAFLFSWPAWAHDAERCAASYEVSQEYRHKGKYLEARQKIADCKVLCPKVLARDCTLWDEELDSAIPSIVVVARDESGRVLQDLRLSVDGRVVAQRLDGTPIEVNPGRHSLQVQGDQGPGTQIVLDVSDGSKGRTVEVRLRSPQPKRTLVTQDESVKPAASMFWVHGLLGLGTAAFASGTVLALSGRSDAQHLRETCKPHCEQDAVDPVFRKLLFADISFGIGIGAVATATWLYLRRPGVTEAPMTKSQFGILPTNHSVIASYQGSF